MQGTISKNTGRIVMLSHLLFSALHPTPTLILHGPRVDFVTSSVLDLSWSSPELKYNVEIW